MSKVSVDVFKMAVRDHSLCPFDLMYNSNALCGEVGEVANVVKKMHMATIRPDWVRRNEKKLPSAEAFRIKLKDELGDLLFYAFSTMAAADLSFEEIMHDQVIKLQEKSKEYGVVFQK